MIGLRSGVRIQLLVALFAVLVLCGTSVQAQTNWPASRPTSPEDIETLARDTGYRRWIDPAGDTDWFRFVMPYDGNVSIFTDLQTDVQGRLEAEDGTFIAEDDNSRAPANFRISTHLSAGTYFLRVSGGHVTDQGEYRLRIYSEPPAWPAPRPTTPENIEPLSLNTSYERAFSARSDTDWYRFTIPAGGGFATMYTTGAADTYGRLEAEDGSYLAHDNDDAVSRNFSIVRSLAAGTYYLRVTLRQPRLQSPFAYGVRVAYTPSPPVWPAPRIDDLVEPLVSGVLYWRSFNRESETDWYQFTLEDSRTVTIYTTGPTDTLARLESAGGAWIAQNDNGGDGSNFRLMSVLNAGTYYLRVTGARPSVVGEYTLQIDTSAAPQPAWPGPRPTPPSSIEEILFDTVYARSLGVANETDWYRIAVPPGGGHLLVHTTGETDTLGRLESESGGWMGQDDNSGAGANFRISRGLPEGTYYLRITGSSAGETGQYSVYASFAPVVAWPASRSSSTVQTLSLGVGHVDSVRPIRDTDWYSFTVPPGGSAVAIYTTGSADTLGRLEYENGSFIAQDANSGQGLNFRLTNTLGPGTYYIRVCGETDQDLGDYSIHVDMLPTVWPVPRPAPSAATETLVLNTPHNSSLTGAGDTDWYQFTLHHQREVAIYTTGSADTLGRLEHEDGSFIAQEANGGVDSNFLIGGMLGPGTYYVRVCGEAILDIGNYSMCLRQLRSVWPESGPPSVSYEPGPGSPEYLIIPTLQPGSTSGLVLNVDATHWYRVIVPSGGGAVTIQTSGQTDMLGRLETMGRAWIAQDDDSGEGGNFRIHRTLSGGHYLLRVTGYDQYTTGYYAIHLQID